MKISPIYRYPSLYTLCMKLLYGKYYNTRFETIAKEIPDGVDLLDVCCGDCVLHAYIGNKTSYVGVDSNPYFVQMAQKRSIRVFQKNLLEEELPMADYVVMLASLYQFIPFHKEIVDKLLRFARRKVLISEPVRNLADSSNPLLSFIARRATNAGAGDNIYRFTQATFYPFFEKNYPTHIEKLSYIPGKRECMVVLRKW